MPEQQEKAEVYGRRPPGHQGGGAEGAIVEMESDGCTDEQDAEGPHQPGAEENILVAPTRHGAGVAPLRPTTSQRALFG